MRDACEECAVAYCVMSSLLGAAVFVGVGSWADRNRALVGGLTESRWSVLSARGKDEERDRQGDESVFQGQRLPVVERRER